MNGHCLGIWITNQREDSLEEPYPQGKVRPGHPWSFTVCLHRSTLGGSLDLCGQWLRTSCSVSSSSVYVSHCCDKILGRKQLKGRFCCVLQYESPVQCGVEGERHGSRNIRLLTHIWPDEDAEGWKQVLTWLSPSCIVVPSWPPAHQDDLGLPSLANLSGNILIDTPKTVPHWYLCFP